jgi:hypothetical protein
MDPSKIPISSTPEITDLKNNPADNSILRKLKRPRKNKKSKDKKKIKDSPRYASLGDLSSFLFQQKAK